MSDSTWQAERDPARSAAEGGPEPSDGDRPQRSGGREPDRPVDSGRGAASTAPHAVRALVRYSGELATKSRRTRSRFQNQLVRNLRDAFESEGIEARIQPEWSRLYVHGADARFLEPLRRTFGISSFSLLLGECPGDLEAIVETGTRLFAGRVRGRTYAVRARRSGTHDFRSYDIHERLGRALNPGATVDLEDPDVTVKVEVRDDRAYFFEDRLAGADGLPLGVQGRAVALLSGGFDSAAAAWMALRRGISLDYVFCNLGGAAYRRMVLEVAKALADRWSYGTRPRLHVVEFGPVVEEMRARAKPAYLQVVLKRLMYRAACRVASEGGGEAIVTGESVGQVSSQTLANLRAIDEAADLPVLRPLVGFHKQEILARCREIGTYELSERVREYCSVAPDKPVTAARAEAARAQEEAVGHDALWAAVAERETVDLRSLRDVEIVGPSLYVEEIPSDAHVIDARPAEAYAKWHWPGAEHRDLETLAREYGALDRSRTWVLYCAEGLRTAYLAERMQRDGYEAYSVLGGAARLRRRDASRTP